MYYFSLLTWSSYLRMNVQKSKILNISMVIVCFNRNESYYACTFTSISYVKNDVPKKRELYKSIFKYEKEDPSGNDPRMIMHYPLVNPTINSVLNKWICCGFLWYYWELILRSSYWALADVDFFEGLRNFVCVNSNQNEDLIITPNSLSFLHTNPFHPSLRTHVRKLRQESHLYSLLKIRHPIMIQGQTWHPQQVFQALVLKSIGKLIFRGISL